MVSENSTPSAQVLIVDDEADHAEVMAEALHRLGHVCTIVHDLAAAREELRHGNFDLVVTDLKMDGDEDGLQVLATARQTQRDAETILVTAHGDVPTAKAAIKGGAYDFIEKPLDLDVFRTLCAHAIQAVALRNKVSDLAKQVDERLGVQGIIGVSPAIQGVLKSVRQVGPSNIPVLITGESGTGKELVARAVYASSERAKKPFKPLNCAGLSESILESELFGHVKGAFTGAERDRQGVFEYADGGTLFLDEIGDMPLPMQAKLLRVLESGEIVRVGSNEPRHVDVRMISATNHDLLQLIKDGRFREDLYFRIRGAQIHLPPLRDRREDIPPLVHYYVAQYARQMHKEPSGAESAKSRPVGSGIDQEAMTVLMRYDWPGNVRQLMNVVQNMVLVCEGGTLDLHQVPVELRQPPDGSPAPGFPGLGDAIGSLTGMTLEQVEKQAIRNALRINQGNREATAKMLGVGERTLYRKLDEYGLK